jgi:hypothetical protein
MTSAINTSNIDGSYPVAGQDNNSQGFRDNFTNIKAGLTVAKSEITGLQLNTAKLNADNNFNGNSVSNAEYNKFYGSVRNAGSINSNTAVDLSNGPLQIFTFTDDFALNFINWPDSDLYAQVRLHLKSDTVAARTVTFSTEAGGSLHYSGADGGVFPSPFTLNISGVHKVVDAWTYDGGTNVYIKYVGQFS